ncbi:hypothetical protein I545_3670 [Mycobacterium kansasii 662]|uniref:Uncharacterized protein n=1 Tax=Mycobacterium kansasii 662 TaxID=1299326 RepID=X7ZDF8_MYCKA|nr:hypothetical protein I545_3670 [Mycobacterium kansasii 662]
MRFKVQLRRRGLEATESVMPPMLKFEACARRQEKPREDFNSFG